MDGWQVAQNYIVAGVIFGGLGGYYYYTTKERKPRARDRTPSTSKRVDSDARPRAPRRAPHERDAPDLASADNAASPPPKAAARPRKRKAKGDDSGSGTTLPDPIQQDAKPDREADMSAAQFARQMAQARQGADLSAPKNKDSRLKTVKQRTAQDPPTSSPAFSSQAGLEAGADADDESTSPTLPAGDVSDMLEPSPAGPSSLRITAPAASLREKAPRQAKEEVVESKKQRQNRKKVEERRVQREEEERQRKALEEKQRRAAREARGEPSRNGVQSAKPPASSPWKQQSAALAADAPPAVNGQHHTPLLDTFDAESTGSSNGGMGASTAATSTTEGDQSHWSGHLSEEDQMAAAIKQSGDDSGWTTVSQPKKSKKKLTDGDADASGTATPSKEDGKASLPPTGPALVNGKANVFSALNTDPSDPSGWDA